MAAFAAAPAALKPPVILPGLSVAWRIGIDLDPVDVDDPEWFDTE